MPTRRRKHQRPKTPPKGLETARPQPRTIPPVVLGAIAVVWAICFMTLHGYQHRPPFAEEANIAWHVAVGHGFRSPMDPSPTAPPSAWSAPLYPLAIAAAYRLFGIGSPDAVTALMLLNAVFLGMIVVGTERLGTSLFGSQVPGLLAAALLSIHPLFLYYLADFWDGFMGLAIFVSLTAAAVRLGSVAESGGRIGYWQAGALGVGMGLLALTNVSYVVSYPVLLYQAFWRTLGVDRWRLPAIACAICLAVITPWTIRNYVAFGRLIPVRTGGALQLWMGNPPVSDGWLEQTAPVHPYINRAERKLLLTIGEPAYNDLALERFKKELLASPVGYLTSCLRRAVYVLVGKPTVPRRYPLLVDRQWHGVFWRSLLLNASVAILGIAGMVAARRFHYRQGALPILALSIAGPFIATGVTDRHSLPVRWLLIVYTGSCVWMLYRWYRGSWHPRHTSLNG